MKPLFLLGLAFMAGTTAFSQIELIGDYEAASDGIYVDDGMFKIYVREYGADTFTLYNTDNSIYRTINFPDVELGGTQIISYITRTLFDCDSTNIEYMIYDYTIGDNPGEGIYSVTIAREDETILLHLDGFSFVEESSESTAGYTRNIQDTPDGAILTLTNGLYNHIDPRRYYRLCGHLPRPRLGSGTITGIGEQPDGYEYQGVTLYPNPASSEIRIDYELPENFTSAELRVFDMNGQLIKTLQVGAHFDHINLNVSSFQSGTYLINLLLENGEVINEKFIKLKN